MTTLRAGVASDTGRVRSINQDSSLVAEPLFAVADGMGGHRAGEVASQVAVEALRASLTDSTLDGLVEAVRAANTAVFDRAADDPDLRGMGTTLCAVAVIDGDGNDGDDGGAAGADGDGDGRGGGGDGDGGTGGERLAVVNVGDSRAYLFRDGELEQLTRDHTLVQTMVDDARITPEEAAVHPQRHIVTRALGIDRHLEVDTWEIVPFVGDRFLVCSDGLFNEVEDDRIAGVLRRLRDPSEAARELVRLANEGGGRDNITVVLVDVVDDDDRAGRASAALAGETTTTGRQRDPDLAGFSSPAPDDTAVVSAVPPGPAPAPRRRRRPTRSERKAARRSRRRVTWRVVLFLLLVLGVLGAAGGAVWWYGRNTYYVAFDGPEVAVFRGRPGGFLWFEPTLVERTGIARDDVPASMTDRLESGVDQGSEDEAQEFVANLEDQIDTVGGRTPTTAPTTTATSSPSSTTTTSRETTTSR